MTCLVPALIDVLGCCSQPFIAALSTDKLRYQDHVVNLCKSIAVCITVTSEPSLQLQAISAILEIATRGARPDKNDTSAVQNEAFYHIVIDDSGAIDILLDTFRNADNDDVHAALLGAIYRISSIAIHARRIVQCKRYFLVVCRYSLPSVNNLFLTL